MDTMDELIDLDYFVESLLGFKLTLAQKSIMSAMSNDRHVCCRMRRRCGKSIGALTAAFYNAVTQKNRNILFIATNMWNCQAASKKMVDLIMDSQLSGTIARYGATRVDFKNGSVIEFIPASSTPNKLHGSRHDLIIVDEAAYIPEEIMVELFAPGTRIRHHSRILLISTENLGNLNGIFGQATRGYGYKSLTFEYSEAFFESGECMLGLLEINALKYRDV